MHINWNQKCPASFIGHLRKNVSKRKNLFLAHPIIDDQYTAARAYLTSVFGLVFF